MSQLLAGLLDAEGHTVRAGTRCPLDICFLELSRDFGRRIIRVFNEQVAGLPQDRILDMDIQRTLNQLVKTWEQRYPTTLHWKTEQIPHHVVFSIDIPPTNYKLVFELVLD